MKELQSQLLAEYISQAYDEIGDQPLTPAQEQLLIDNCIQQVAADSYPLSSQADFKAETRG